MALEWNMNSQLQVEEDEVAGICVPAEVLLVSPSVGDLDSCSDRLQRNGQEHLEFPDGHDEPDDDDSADDDPDGDDRGDDFEDDDFDEEEFDDSDDEEDIDDDIDEDVDEDDDDFDDDDF